MMVLMKFVCKMPESLLLRCFSRFHVEKEAYVFNETMYTVLDTLENDDIIFIMSQQLLYVYIATDNYIHKNIVILWISIIIRNVCRYLL